MNARDFQAQLRAFTPEVPAHFHSRVERTLEDIVKEETEMKENVSQAIRRAGRYSTRTVALALLLAALLAAVALAATQWHVFEPISFFTGKGTPNRADEVIQGNLYRETINGVEVTVREAGYDGRTLFLQYSFRMMDVDEAYGDGFVRDEVMELLAEHRVGWWMDQIWFDGKGMDMPAGSFSDVRGSDVPGEIIETDVWRIENEEVRLEGPVQISLPIGETQDLRDYRRSEHPEKYDEDGDLLLPEQGVVTFTYDATGVSDKVVTYTPNVETVFPEMKARVSEAAFSPIMTYITLATEVRPEAMAAFIAEHGDGYYNDEGELLFPYDGGDVIGESLETLQLVDGEGNILFPDTYALDGYSPSWAELDYPYIENMPEELYLAPVEDGRADLSLKILVKGKDD